MVIDPRDKEKWRMRLSDLGTTILSPRVNNHFGTKPSGIIPIKFDRKPRMNSIRNM